MPTAKDLIDKVLHEGTTSVTEQGNAANFKKAQDELYKETQKLISKLATKYKVGRYITWKGMPGGPGKAVLEVTLYENS